jgi:RecB family endonuclease NucS
MNTENNKLKLKIEKYHETLVEERKIKDQLVEKLNIIKELVNMPLSRNKSTKAGKIDFLAGNNSLQNNFTPMEIINKIKRIL